MFNVITLLVCCIFKTCKFVHGNQNSTSRTEPIIPPTNVSQICQTDFECDTQVLVIHPNNDYELVAY